METYSARRMSTPAFPSGRGPQTGATSVETVGPEGRSLNRCCWSADEFRCAGKQIGHAEADGPARRKAWHAGDSVACGCGRQEKKEACWFCTDHSGKESEKTACIALARGAGHAGMKVLGFTGQAGKGGIAISIPADRICPACLSIHPHPRVDPCVAPAPAIAGTGRHLRQ